MQNLLKKWVLPVAAGLLLSWPSLAGPGCNSLCLEQLPVPALPSRPLNVSRARLPALYAKGEGSYQLADGNWHRAKKLEFDGTTLAVKDDLTAPLSLTATTLKQFEVQRDTFLLVSNLPEHAATAGPEWVESLFYQRGVRLLAQYISSPQLHWYLRLPQEPFQELSTDRTEFKQAMLALVKDCPALVRKITRNTLGRDRVVDILAEYVECQTAASAVAEPAPEPETEPAKEPSNE
ncbi:MAG: hypothetical protein ACRYFX_28730 [Janthinobacterium lividum]